MVFLFIIYDFAPYCVSQMRYEMILAFSDLRLDDGSEILLQEHVGQRYFDILTLS